MRRLQVLSGLLAALALASPARAADRDPWFGPDKALHVGVSAGIAAGSYAIGAAIFDARGHALIAAGSFTLAIGAAKELHDLAGYGDPSWKDFAADAVGTLAGLAVAWSIDLLVRGVNREHPAFWGPRPLVVAF